MDLKPTAGISHDGLARSSQMLVLGLAGGVVIAAIVVGPLLYHRIAPGAATEQAAAPAQPATTFKPTPQQLASLTLQPVVEANFRAERSADGKIALDDDLSTPVYPPYTGRVLQVFVKAGDHVERGAPLFKMESTDLVQAQNDFISASAALNKARSQVGLLGVAARRQQALLAVQGAALKDVQQAQADLTGAQNDQRSAEIALAAVRDRLRILGVTDQDIAQLDATRRTNPQLTVPAPIAGTVMVRKLGLGEYLSSGATDPVITIGDFAKVWLIANVRESDAALVAIGQAVDVRVTAYPDRVFKATISYVAASVDSSTHRLPIRAEVKNPEGLLKPEMFADFTIAVSSPHKGLAVPQEAVVFEGDAARVWVEQPDNAIASHPIKIGVTNGATVEALSGVAAGDKVVTRGSLFVDHAASED
jgi:cobalt-zinc-cadmium efflux system membrane fusion protein